MQIIEMRRSDMEGNLKAFFKVQTEEGFIIDGFKIMNGKNGLFAGMPSKKVGEKFIETVTAARELKTEVSRLALAAYNALDTTGSTDRSMPPPPPADTDLPF
jgi:DNA-binding cell septation regulator SpoVG